MYDFTFSGAQVLLGGGLLVLCLGVLFFLFKHYSNQKPRQLNTESNRTKYAYADIFRHRSTLLRVGLISSLAFTLMAFNWTQYDASSLSNGTIGMEIIDVENITPITFHPPPPPPPPPPQPIIEVLEDDQIEESKTFESMDIHVDDPVVPMPFVPKSTPKTVTPPRIIDEGPILFKIVERMPVFGDCSDGKTEETRRNCSSNSLIGFINKRVTYPAIAREISIEGTVVVRFVIEKDGAMTNLEIIRNLGGGLGEEALRVVRLMAESGHWTAGQQRGRPVRVQFNLPVKFQLQH